MSMALEVNKTDVKAISGTTTSVHEVGLMVTFTNKNTTHAECTAHITPCLRNISYNEVRYQHIWNVYFAIDNKPVKSYLKQTLPNITTATMTMKKNQWYKWGPTYDYTFKNDGKPHNFGVYLHCTATTPRYCPAYNTYTYTGQISTAIYTITPSTPAGLKTTFVENTRKITYSWNAPTNTSSIKLARTLYDDNDTPISAPNVFTLKSTDKSYTETLADNVSRVDYTVTNISSTNHTASSGIISYNDIPTDCKVWIKLSDGKWVKAVPWVKLPDGTWKKSIKTYTKVGNVWKRTIM